MSAKERSPQNRSVSIGGNVKDSQFVIGNHNCAHFNKVSLVKPNEVDMRAELAAIKEAVCKLASPDSGKIRNAFQHAEEELAKPDPDKDEIGLALDRALKYAKEADDFASTAESLKSHIANAAAWLGENWHKILGVVGLIV